MDYPDYKYVELAINGYKNKPRNNIVTLDAANKIIASCKPYECYRSHFRFPEEMKTHVERDSILAYDKPTVKGYDGPTYSDFLWLDLDRDPLSTALKDAQSIISQLEFIYHVSRDDLRMYFSGAKGFHLGIPMVAFGLEPSLKFSQQCKSLALEIVGDIEIDKSVYDKTRLFRLSNTQHAGSNLYKVELLPNELMECDDMEVIKSLAKSPRLINRTMDTSDIENAMIDLVGELPELSGGNGDSAKVHSPSDNWIVKLLEEGAQSGSRIFSTTRLAGYFKSQGLPIDIYSTMLRGWDLTKNQPPLQTESPEEKSKFEKAILDISNYPDKAESSDVEKQVAEFVYHNYGMDHTAAPEYLAHLDETRIKFGLPNIDRDSMGLGLGELCTIIGYVHVGKTALAQTLQLNITDRQRIPSIMFAMEMSAMRLHIRRMAMIGALSIAEVESDYRNGKMGGYDQYADRYKDCYVVDHVPMSIELIGEYIDNAPAKIGLAIIDYISLLDSDNIQDPYQRMTALSKGLMQLAKAKQIAMIIMVQTNRSGARGEIDMSMARDSGYVEADADIILGLYKDPDNEDRRKLKLLKSRHGLKAGVVENLGFMGASPRMIPLIDDEKEKK